MKNYTYLQQKYMVDTYPNRGVTLIHGEGIYLFDEKENKYLDLMSNYGVNIFGYNHPRIKKMLLEQLGKLSNLHGSFANDKRAEASQELVKRCGGKYAKVYWSNSGSEAVEVALKFAVLATAKKKFITAKGAYHGKTLGALSASGSEKYRKPFEPLLWEVTHIEYGEVEQLENEVDDETAAVVLEPIQGEAGVIIPPQDYLPAVRKVCNEQGILLIVDEIQTGVGRTETFLASQGVEADILCLGKGLAAGLPIGATLVTESVAREIPKASHTSTFGGNPLTCAGVLAVLSLVNKNLLQHVQQVGEYFLASLNGVTSDKVVATRGKGLMLGIEVREGQTKILKELQQRKILAIPAGKKVVRFLPPYLIEEKDIDRVVSVLQSIFE